MNKFIRLTCRLLLIVWLPTPTNAQAHPGPGGRVEPFSLKGIVVSQKTQLPLAYVNIGLLNKSIGTVSDTTGHFQLLVKEENLADTLQISLIGYGTYKMPVRDWKSGERDTIRLEEREYVLSEVTVSAGKGSSEVVGRQKDGGFVQFALHPKKEIAMGTEFGMKFKAEEYPALLNNFNFYLSGNNFKKIKFRVNIYSLRDNLPDSLLFNKEVYVDVLDYKSGWSRIDLSAYQVKVQEDFAVSLQWVAHSIAQGEAPKVFIPGAMGLGQTSYFRVASQDKWSKAKAGLCYYVTLVH